MTGRIDREMHTTSKDMSRKGSEGDEAYGSCIAVSSSSAAEAALISKPRFEAVRSAAGTADTVVRSRMVTSQSGDPPRFGLCRIRDIVCALALIIVLLPVFVVLIAVILINDPGPPIFAHQRVGKNGRPFKCFKLRSMYCDAQERLVVLLANNPQMRREWEAMHKLAEDPRVTPLGDFLRRTSLDELPQLFNVLMGSMTLVGPRPIVYDELRHYGRHASCYLTSKPGLTGLWQVTGRSEVSYRRRVATDRLYARRKSFKLDLRILLATVPAVLARKGAC